MFAGEVIDRLDELQSLKVDETKEKDWQKSEAKIIVHRRRKALTDLFKALELIGACSCSCSLILIWFEKRKFVVYTDFLCISMCVVVLIIDNCFAVMVMLLLLLFVSVVCLPRSWQCEMFAVNVTNHCLLCAGLSFKKGLLKLNASTDADMLQCFTLPPCNVNIAVGQLKKDRYILIVQSSQSFACLW